MAPEVRGAALVPCLLVACAAGPQVSEVAAPVPGALHRRCLADGGCTAGACTGWIREGVVVEEYRTCEIPCLGEERWCAPGTSCTQFIRAVPQQPVCGPVAEDRTGEMDTPPAR